MTKLYVRAGGLMEDPEFHWEEMGEAEGTTLKEVCDNLAAKDPGFAAEYNPEYLTYWGWRLSLTKEDTPMESLHNHHINCEVCKKAATGRFAGATTEQINVLRCPEGRELAEKAFPP